MTETGSLQRLSCIAVCLVLITVACGGNDEESITTSSACATSFETAPTNISELADQDASESFVSFQSGDEWEGGSDVCWATVIVADSCLTFSYVLDGPRRTDGWVFDGEIAPPCPAEGIALD